jgi:hypothetical protein
MSGRFKDMSGGSKTGAIRIREATVSEGCLEANEIEFD